MDRSFEADVINAMRQLLDNEIHSLKLVRQVFEELSADFLVAVNLLSQATTRLTTGMGTSGILARKLAASLTSIGYPTHYLHPADAEHGNFGYVTEQTCLVALSNSGSTAEILRIAKSVKRISSDSSLILIARTQGSAIGRISTVELLTGVTNEADPLQLVPTSSAVTTLAIGDSLVAGLEILGRVERDTFLRNHPSGALGASLSIKFVDLMSEVKTLKCVVAPHEELGEAIAAMSRDRFGACVVVEDDSVLGIFTDGDLRRLVERQISLDLRTPIKNFMTQNPKTVRDEELVGSTLLEMEKSSRKVTCFPVVNSVRKLVGLVHVHDFLRSGQ